MKKRAVIVAIVAAALLLAGVDFWGPSSVPSGQEPLTVLSLANLSDFVAVFDAGSDVPRMVLLLSPT
jgi:hypothetical protein